MSSDDVTGEMPMPDDEGGESLHPIEDAWLDGQPELVETLAREQLVVDPRDFASHGWLGLALWVMGKTTAAQRSLEKAFELIASAQAAETDDEVKEQRSWEPHGLANRLVDAFEADPPRVLGAARFVVEGLKFDHAPSLRLLAEHVADEGDVVKALALLKRALAADGADAETHYLAARLFARVGKKALVLRHLHAALEHSGGAIAVRGLARHERDFDGLREDGEFVMLTDLFPKEPVLRPLYEALDAGEFATVAKLAPKTKRAAAHALDVLYPSREALERLLDDESAEEATWTAALEQVNAEIEAQEEAGAPSPAWARYCGDV